MEPLGSLLVCCLDFIFRISQSSAQRICADLYEGSHISQVSPSACTVPPACSVSKADVARGPGDLGEEHAASQEAN